jgi:hypothetical protein
VRTLRYGTDVTWPFSGEDLDPNVAVLEAYLTFKDNWATSDTEEGTEPPRLQLLVTTTPSEFGQITEPQDGEGNWACFFILNVPETTDSLDPPPRVLWYEVTLKCALIAEA